MNSVKGSMSMFTTMTFLQVVAVMRHMFWQRTSISWESNIRLSSINMMTFSMKPTSTMQSMDMVFHMWPLRWGLDSGDTSLGTVLVSWNFLTIMDINSRLRNTLESVQKKSLKDTETMCGMTNITHTTMVHWWGTSTRFATSMWLSEIGRWRCAIWNSLKKSWNKFGGFNYFLYLCIGNTEVTKTLLLEKEQHYEREKVYPGWCRW